MKSHKWTRVGCRPTPVPIVVPAKETFYSVSLLSPRDGRRSPGVQMKKGEKVDWSQKEGTDPPEFGPSKELSQVYDLSILCRETRDPRLPTVDVRSKKLTECSRQKRFAGEVPVLIVCDGSKSRQKIPSENPQFTENQTQSQNGGWYTYWNPFDEEGEPKSPVRVPEHPSTLLVYTYFTNRGITDCGPVRGSF